MPETNFHQHHQIDKLIHFLDLLTYISSLQLMNIKITRKCLIILLLLRLLHLSYFLNIKQVIVISRATILILVVSISFSCNLMVWVIVAITAFRYSSSSSSNHITTSKMNTNRSMYYLNWIKMGINTYSSSSSSSSRITNTKIY